MRQKLKIISPENDLQRTNLICFLHLDVGYVTKILPQKIIRGYIGIWTIAQPSKGEKCCTWILFLDICLSHPLPVFCCVQLCSSLSTRMQNPNKADRGVRNYH